MNPCNFAALMERVRRIVFFSLTLLLWTSSAFSAVESDTTTPGRHEDVNPFKENGKIGLKNRKGDILIPAQYDALGWSDGSFSFVENVTGYALNGRWGLLDLTNHKVTKPEFNELNPGGGSMILARKKITNSILVLMGCISPAGKVIIPFEYDGIKLTDLRAIVWRKNKTRFNTGVIDFENKVIIPLAHRHIYSLGSLRFGVTSWNDKTAIFSEEGEQLTGFLIDSISSFRSNYAIIYQDRLQGLINREGKTVLEPVYSEVLIEDDGTVRTRMPDQWLLLDGDNKLVRDIHADALEPIEKGLYKIGMSGNYQLGDGDFKVLTPTVFSDISVFRNGRAIVTADGKKGVIARNGSVIIPTKYAELVEDNGLFRATEITTSGIRSLLLDSSAVVLTQKSYQFIGPFNEEFFPAKHKGYWGAIDIHGREIIACVHDSLGQVKGDRVVVKFKGQYGVISTDEQWIVTPQANKLLLVDNTRYIEIDSSASILKSVNGTVIYFTSNPFEINSDHLLERLPSGEVWRVDLNGVIAQRYTPAEKVEKIFRESEGYRAIKKDGRYGFIDSRSRLRIANRYEEVQDFSEGLAGVKILGKWGFLNKEDRIAVQPVYDEVSPFNEGFALVKSKGALGLIDKKGKLVLPVRYEEIKKLGGGLFRIRQSGWYGMSDSSGKVLINPKYESLEVVSNEYFIIGRDGKFGVVTSSGMSTIPLIYERLFFDRYNQLFIVLKKTGWETPKL